MIKEQLWTELYRPKTVQDTILPAHLKEIFQSFVDKKFVPNLLLTGSTGIGKTTIAKAMLNQLEAEYIIINGSLERNIDTLRYDIQRFASSLSMFGSKKYVIIDEADGLNAQSTQPALKAFIEEYSKNCGFIFTCNYQNRILPELRGRCAIVEFKIAKSEAAGLANDFFNKITEILDIEKVKYDKKAVAAIINLYYPDWRHIINELQKYSSTGCIDSGILSTTEGMKPLIGYLKDKNFTNVRKWVAEHTDNDATSIYRHFYDTASQHFQNNSIPILVMLIAKYQGAFCADSEINLAAFFVEVMGSCAFK